MNTFDPNIETSFDSYKISRLTKNNIPQLQKLLESSADYFKLVFDKNVQPNEAEDLLNQLPKGKTLEDKFDYGVYCGQDLIGIMDLIRDYPEQGIWFIGLLLFRPDQRRKGLGKKIITIFSEKLKTFGASKMRISIANQNIDAAQFWRKIGFLETNTGREGSNQITYFDFLLV